MADPIDLGRPFICLKGVDLVATVALYEKLGFTSKKDLSPAQEAEVRFLRQGTNALAFFATLFDAVILQARCLRANDGKRRPLIMIARTKPFMGRRRRASWKLTPLPVTDR